MAVQSATTLHDRLHLFYQVACMIMWFSLYAADPQAGYNPDPNAYYPAQATYPPAGEQSLCTAIALCSDC